MISFIISLPSISVSSFLIIVICIDMTTYYSFLTRSDSLNHHYQDTASSAYTHYEQFGTVFIFKWKNGLVIEKTIFWYRVVTNIECFEGII